MQAVPLDVERKYVVDDAIELSALTGLVLGADDERALSDGAVTLAAGESGLTLRRRAGGDDAGWHLEIPAGPGARSEVRLPAGRAGRTVPAALRRLIRVHSGDVGCGRAGSARPVAHRSSPTCSGPTGTR